MKRFKCLHTCFLCVFHPECEQNVEEANLFVWTESVSNYLLIDWISLNCQWKIWRCWYLTCSVAIEITELIFCHPAQIAAINQDPLVTTQRIIESKSRLWLHHNQSLVELKVKNCWISRLQLNYSRVGHSVQSFVGSFNINYLFTSSMGNSKLQ